ncbi:hypothetical protein GCM10011375_31530 [Hymenobacter qilianensis]|uniref:Uncharacterized protein n=2 Tax=Hymenobacter qilianensis TaxID=1385715 RepID=A0ACB5PUS3_9BACT|nr:DUF5996 family protein [Hymenobacter qilianensis]QNP51542.1 hypothetical protein H9L05_16305 [Hymenobacter qilianensis]GGF74109.1 hypothetical protein GCM10011375_31530 [Hymenobacter qilianensis]
MTDNALASQWPALPADSWTDTRETLHRWTQIVGKTRLALSPMLNHWWQVPLYVTPRGLSTGPMPYAAGSCEVVFDFRAHQLRVHTSDGRTHELALEPRSVADFYQAYRGLLREAGIAVKLWPVPVEIEDTTPFTQDQIHRAYDARAAETFWEVLLRADQVLQEFRSRFRGKCSSVHFFWGSFDLAVTRFSGRPAPPHPGGIPHLADWVTRESYSEEQIAAGWWPGGNGQEAAFYSYAYPGLPELANAPIEPVGGFFNQDMGEFLLPYEAARTAPDPRQAVLHFLQSTYEAAATLAHWDRAALERA